MKILLKEIAVLVSGCLFVLVIAGCASDKKTQADPFFDEWRAKAESSKGYSPKSRSPLPKTAKKKPPKKGDRIDLKNDTRQLPSQKISLKMHDTPISVLLRALAKAAGQSIVISNSVEGTANINVVSEPWRNVFLGILNTYGLSFEWSGSLIKIKTHVDYEKEWERTKAVLRQKEAEWQLKHVEAFETEIFFIRYAKAEKLAVLLRDIIDSTGSGKLVNLTDQKDGPIGNIRKPSLTFDPDNNAILVHATRAKIDQIADVILELDRPTQQIFIEAQIVETNRDTARALGIQWGGLNYEQNGDKLNWIGGPLGTLDGSLFTEADGDDPGGDPIIHLPSIGNIVNFPATLKDGTGATLGYQLQDLSSNYLLRVQLTALQEEGKLNILSAPSITTLDNQEASIESGREVPFQTVEDDEVKIEFKKAVLSLKVTPHTIDDNTLRLNIITHKDELDFTNDVQGNPTIITKNAETNVILYDGQTMVIGGLTKETSSDGESGVPVLKDIPYMGRLFRSNSKSNNMEEVLIFITPHILKEQPISTSISSTETQGQSNQ